MATDFEQRAASWDDDPGKVERGRVVAQRIRDTLAVDPGTRVLEYGAGTGLASQALVGHVGDITLADPSEGMRRVMTDKIDAGVFPPTTRVWDLDLATDPPPVERFDLVLTVMTLHHITDLDPVLAGLASLLDDGGCLAVVDLEEDPHGSFHRGDPDFEGHHGFRRADLAARLEAAGFTDVAFTDCHTVDKEGGTYPLFLATASVPTT